MKKAKQIISIIIIFTMLLGGCSPAATVDNNEPNENQNTDVAEDNTQDNTEDNSENNTEEENASTEIIDEVVDDIQEDTEENDLTSTQRNSINMLNYITVLTQQINASKGSRVYLESVQSSLQNDIYPNAVDTDTQNQINNLWRTIDDYRMIIVKRERLDYIYEQNKAQALRQAIPNPLGLLSTVQSGGMLKTAASVIYMAVDSVSSYQAASTQTDLKYLQDNWELDDEEAKELSESQLNLLNYKFDMVRDNDFPGEWALTSEAVKDFVKWVNEPNIASRINWLESSEETYREFRTYWLELAKSYYEHAEKYNDTDSYRKCLVAIENYEEVATRIFMKDHDYAKTLPMVILSAKEVLNDKDYAKTAEKYAEIINKNCEEEDWTLKYFAAQIYVDLYAVTENEQYLLKAYEIADNNANALARKQEELNSAYLAEVELEKTDDDASKREKKEIEEYNDLLKEKRKVELPPVNEAFYLNCELLLALAEELDMSQSAKKGIDNYIHTDGNPIFLSEALDEHFWAGNPVGKFDVNDIEIKFNGKELEIPATCVTERSEIKVVTADRKELAEWIVKEVDREGKECSDYTVTFTSKQGKEYKYTAGSEVKVIVELVAGDSDKTMEFTYKAVEKKTLGIIKTIKFERVK